MMAFIRYRGTETDPWTSTGSPTDVHYDFGCIEEATYNQITWSNKKLLQLENASKATGMMIVLARRYRPACYNLPFIKYNQRRKRKMLFSQSGKLPRRIKRIKKGR